MHATMPSKHTPAEDFKELTKKNTGKP